jgi:ribosome production factor 2
MDLQGKKIKSVRRDNFGSKLGRLHMTKQDVNTLQTRKMKGLKKTYGEKKLKRKSDTDKNGPATKIPKNTSTIQNKKLKKFSKKGRKLKGGQV